MTKPLFLSNGVLGARGRRRLLAFTRPLQDGLPQEILDLTIDTPQVVLGPALQLGPEITVNAKEKGLPFTHVAPSCVERSRIDHGVNFGFAAKDNHEIAHHGRAALVVEMDDVF
jgi:hypothetical protein